MSARKARNAIKNKNKHNKKKPKTLTRSRRAGLTFPVSRMERKLRERKVAPRIGNTAPVYLSAVIEYFIAEVIYLSGIVAKDQKKKRITPRHIMLATRDDIDFKEFLRERGVCIPQAGVIPHIDESLLPHYRKNNKKRRT